ncbi:hypothetical protein ACFX2G_000122 [Malus domestica]
MDNAFKLGLKYFVEAILIRAKNNVAMNLDYLDLMANMDMFNSFTWNSRSDLRCSKTFGFVHQHLAPSVGIDTKSYVVTAKSMSSAPGPGHSSSVRNTTGYYRPTNRADEISPVEFQDRPGSNHEVSF